MDKFAIFGSILGLVGIIGGNMLEGGHIGALVQGPAAVIVFGGTFGAMFLSYPAQDIRNAFRYLPRVYQEFKVDVRPVIAEIVEIATVARKEGVLAVEGRRESIENPLFRKTIKFVIDGFEPDTVKEIIDAEIYIKLEEEENAGRVWEGAGGYAPTVGIIGAVLGLIHVMQNLADPSAIGGGGSRSPS